MPSAVGGDARAVAAAGRRAPPPPPAARAVDVDAAAVIGFALPQETALRPAKQLDRVTRDARKGRGHIALRRESAELTGDDGEAGLRDLTLGGAVQLLDGRCRDAAIVRDGAHHVEERRAKRPGGGQVGRRRTNRLLRQTRRAQPALECRRVGQSLRQ